MNQKVKRTSICQAVFFCLAFLLFFAPLRLTAASTIVEISSIEEFYQINDCLNCDYQLVSDLDFSDPQQQILNYEYFDETLGWAMIGTSTQAFSGTFNGNGYTIKGFNTNRVNDNYVGIFPIIQYAHITNVNIRDVSIRGKNYVGGLVGYARYDSLIHRVSLSGNVEGNEYVGGIIGDGYRSNFDTLYSNATVRAPALRIGGIIGRLASLSSLSNAHSQARVQGYNCSKPTQISCVVGGVIGTTITGTNVSSVFFNGELYHDELLASVDDKTIYAKPIIGFTQNTNNNHMYYTYQSNLFEDPYIATEDLNKQESYEGFDFEFIWSMGDTAYLIYANANNLLPILESIEVSSLPDQTEFDEDQEIDLTGLQVIANYDDNTQTNIELNDLEIIFDKESQLVTINFENKTTSFDILINPVPNYLITIEDVGFGGKTYIVQDDLTLDITNPVRQDTHVKIKHNYHALGRVESIVINSTVQDSEDLIINSDKNIVVNYYLLGDNNQDTLLNNLDLALYPMIIKNSIHNKISDTNEDNHTDISDFVTLRNFIIHSTANSLEKLNTTPSDLSFEFIDSIIEDNKVKVNVKVQSTNVGALYLRPTLSDSISYSIASAISDLILDDENEVVIVSPNKTDQLINESINLEFVLPINGLSESFTLTLSNIQYSDSSGIITTTLPNQIFNLELEAKDDALIVDNPSDESENKDSVENRIPPLGTSKSNIGFNILLFAIIIVSISAIKNERKVI